MVDTHPAASAAVWDAEDGYPSPLFRPPPAPLGALGPLGVGLPPSLSTVGPLAGPLGGHHHRGGGKPRKTRKSLQREKLERTFKEKGFLIQTQQLESAEGATYCKFRQLRKFTRYLFRSWKDYLPDGVRDGGEPNSTEPDHYGLAGLGGRNLSDDGDGDAGLLHGLPSPRLG